MTLLSSEDAHRLEGVRDAETTISLDVEGEGADAVRKALFQRLGGRD